MAFRNGRGGEETGSSTPLVDRYELAEKLEDQETQEAVAIKTGRKGQ